MSRLSDTPSQLVEEQPQPSTKCSPRVPYTHTKFITDSCVSICNKPYDPAQNRCYEIIVCWIPCAIIADILCCVPMTFGCYTISKPN
jgi:hypothetical protein